MYNLLTTEKYEFGLKNYDSFKIFFFYEILFTESQYYSFIYCARIDTNVVNTYI